MTTEEMAKLREALTASLTSLSMSATPAEAPRLVETARTLESVSAAEAKLSAELGEAKRLAAQALKRADEVAKAPLPGVSLSAAAATPLTAASRKELASVEAAERKAREGAKAVLAGDLSRLTRAEATSALASARDSLRCVQRARRITASAVLLERVKQLDKVRKPAAGALSDEADVRRMAD